MKSEREALYQVTVKFRDGSWRTTYKRSYPSSILKLAGEIMHRHNATVQYVKVI